MTLLPMVRKHYIAFAWVYWHEKCNSTRTHLLVVFPLLNYSAPWRLWMMFLKHDDLNFRRNVAHRKSHVWNWSAILPGMCTRREASLQEIRCPNGRQMEDMERRGSKLVCLGQQHWRDPEAFTCSFFSWKFGIHLLYTHSSSFIPLKTNIWHLQITLKMNIIFHPLSFLSSMLVFGGVV